MPISSLLKRIRKRAKHSQRTTHALLASVANVASQGANLATGLISVPLALSYLSPTDFTIWMTILGVTAALHFTDLGTTLGMQDQITRLMANQRRSDAAAIFLRTLAFVSTVVVSITLISLVAAQVLSHHNPSQAHAYSASTSTILVVLASVASMAIGVIGGVFQRALIGLQRSYVPAVSQAITKGCGLAGLIIATNNRLGLEYLILATLGVANILNLVILSIYTYTKTRWLLKPENKNPPPPLRPLISTGIAGLGASAASYLFNTAPLPVLTMLEGASYAAAFAILAKLTSIPILLFSQIIAPFWPAITDARALADWRWLQRTMKVVISICIAVACFFSLTIYAAANTLVASWTKNAAPTVENALLAPAVLLMFSIILSIGLTSILNGLSDFKYQSKVALTCSISALCLCPTAQLLFDTITHSSLTIWIFFIASMLANAMYAARIQHLWGRLTAGSEVDQ